MARAEGILRLLLVDDSLTDADSIAGILRSAGHAVRASRQNSVADIEKSLTSQTWDLIICRDTTTAISPREVLNLLNRLGRDIPCIVLVSKQDNIEMNYELGAQDIIKFSDTKRLQFAVGRELQNLFSRRLARRNERALRESEKRSRLLLESSRDAVAYMHEGMHIYVNTAYLSLFGYDNEEDIDGLPILDMIKVEEQARFKSIFRQFSEQTDSKPQFVFVQCIRANGSGFKAKIEFSHAEVEGENCTQVIVRDESIETSSNERLQLLLDHDLLTGLHGRAQFRDALEQIVNKAGEAKGDAELLYIVIDDFQVIKEQVGLGASDVILKDIAMLFRNVVVAGETLARYSDQVFTVIIESDDDGYVLERAKAYQEAASSYKSNVNGTTVELLCSIGISRITEKSTSITTVLDNADRACAKAQHEDGNHIERYQSELLESNNSMDKASVWQIRLQEALKNDEFELFYQPIVSLHGREQELYDVLLRLKEGDGSEPLAANKFIQYANQSDWMDTLDEWVIIHALKSLVEHHKEHPKTRFFIRLSKQTLAKTEFIDWLCKLLTSYGLKGDSLVFEISETAAIENLENAKAMISKLKDVGCEFALEHFGSGLDFSRSLSELDVDYLKINGDFVEHMTKDAENQAAVKAIIEMTKEAGKQSIAEFVSDANSLALLWRLGIDYAQGYYIHEPSEALDYNFEDDDL
ncbi:MAG: EAL domain-containing protein [Piscirickettsiaceae bacterium]|nr:EAL domain-containing protein [Piscirickettsiaceae bacterium]